MKPSVIDRRHLIMQALLLFASILATRICDAAESTRLVCRVVDADTGELLPCRAYAQSEQGTWHFAQSMADDGTAVRYDVTRSPESFEKHTTLSAHPFKFELPPGRSRIVVERGKEYHPAELSVNVENSPLERTIRLKQWINMEQRRWYSGDTHVHRSLADLPNVMRAEDLNVALPLSYWVRDAYTPPLRGDKSVPAESRLIHVDRDRVIWPMNTEYEIFTVNGKRHTLGAVFVLNHQTPLAPSAPPVAPIAAEARRQHALLDLDKHSWPWSMMLVPIMNVDLFELSNNHIWRTDFFFKRWTLEQLPQAWNIETDSQGFTEWGWMDFGFKTYYALLNCGFHMRPTAGTASGVHPVPLGFGRVYVSLPDGFDYQNWIDGLNAGRSFVTTGPMLFAEFNGRSPGSKFQSTGPTTLRVHGEAHSRRPLDRIEIVKNGEIVRTITPAANTGKTAWVSSFDESFEVDNTSWFAVRCFQKHPQTGRLRFAHSAPVYVTVPGRPLRPHAVETEFLVQAVQSEIRRNREVLSDDELAEYERALEIYRKLHQISTP